MNNRKERQLAEGLEFFSSDGSNHDRRGDFDPGAGAVRPRLVFAAEEPIKAEDGRNERSQNAREDLLLEGLRLLRDEVQQLREEVKGELATEPTGGEEYSNKHLSYSSQASFALDRRWQ